MEFTTEQEQRFEDISFGPVQPVQAEAFESDRQAQDFVNWCLDGSYNDQGIASWWNRPRHELGDISPIQAWPTQSETVIRMAHYLVGAAAAS